MTKENLHFILNDDIIEQLKLTKGQKLEAELYADKLVLQREEEPERRTIPSWVLIMATVLLSLLFFAISSAQNRNQIQVGLLRSRARALGCAPCHQHKGRIQGKGSHKGKSRR